MFDSGLLYLTLCSNRLEWILNHFAFDKCEELFSSPYIVPRVVQAYWSRSNSNWLVYYRNSYYSVISGVGKYRRFSKFAVLCYVLLKQRKRGPLDGPLLRLLA